MDILEETIAGVTVETLARIAGEDVGTFIRRVLTGKSAPPLTNATDAPIAQITDGSSHPQLREDVVAFMRNQLKDGKEHNSYGWPEKLGCSWPELCLAGKSIGAKCHRPNGKYMWWIPKPERRKVKTIRRADNEPMLVVELGSPYEDGTRLVKLASGHDGVIRYKTTKDTLSVPFQKGAYIKVTGDIRVSEGLEKYVRLAKASFEALK